MNMKIDFRVVLIAVAVLLYVISPIDAAPDVVPGIGWIDDIAVFVLGGRKAMQLAKDNAAAEAERISGKRDEA